MDEVNELTKRQKIIRNKCKLLKDKIFKTYPGAHVRVSNSKFYVVDAFGNRILKDENRVDSTSVFDAWKQTAIALHNSLEVQRNSLKFNDEAVLMRMMRKLTAGENAPS